MSARTSNTAVVEPEEVVEKTSPEAEYVPPADPKPSEDVERLLPGPGEPVSLEDGTQVLVNPLRLREFLAMLKIVTRGAAFALGQVRLDTNDENFVQDMIAMFIFAIPEAEDEACDFVRIMVTPYFEGKPTADEIAKAAADLDDKMENPELEDLFTVIEIVINREGSDLRRLGKRLSNALAFMQKTGQV